MWINLLKKLWSIFTHPGDRSSQLCNGFTCTEREEPKLELHHASFSLYLFWSFPLPAGLLQH